MAGAERCLRYGTANTMHKAGGYGATVEGNYVATEAAKKEVEDFLARERRPATSKPGAQ